MNLRRTYTKKLTVSGAAGYGIPNRRFKTIESDICQQGRNHTALRRAFFCLKVARPFHVARFQPPT
jgi:hypothetical protein